MESYEGLRTVRSSGGEAGTMARINRQFAALFRAGMRIIRRMAALMGLNEFSSQIVITICLTVVALALRVDERMICSALLEVQTMPPWRPQNAFKLAAELM